MVVVGDHGDLLGEHEPLRAHRVPLRAADPHSDGHGRRPASTRHRAQSTELSCRRDANASGPSRSAFAQARPCRSRGLDSWRTSARASGSESRAVRPRPAFRRRMAAEQAGRIDPAHLCQEASRRALRTQASRGCGWQRSGIRSRLGSLRAAALPGPANRVDRRSTRRRPLREHGATRPVSAAGIAGTRLPPLSLPSVVRVSPKGRAARLDRIEGWLPGPSYSARTRICDARGAAEQPLLLQKRSHRHTRDGLAPRVEVNVVRKE